MGIYLDKTKVAMASPPWRVQLHLSYRDIHIGYYATEAEAEQVHAQYVQAFGINQPTSGRHWDRDLLLAMKQTVKRSAERNKDWLDRLIRRLQANRATPSRTHP